jgi:predicted flap endonuclease-1-like 5' DNA nuclease
MMEFLTGLFIIGIGLLAVFFGYRIFRILLPFLGGIAGFIIGQNLFPGNWFLALIFGIAIAIVLALLSYWVWSFMFTISGAVAGASLGAAIANSLNLWDWVSWLLVIGLAILFFILVWRFRDEMVIVITALAGASLVSEGLRLMFGEGTFRNILWWGVFFVLAAIGIVFQWSRFLRLQMYRQIGEAAEKAVASGATADLAAPARAAAASTTATGVAVAGGATAAAAAAATAAKREADQAAAATAAAAGEAAAATRAAAADVSTTAAAAVAAPKLTAEEKQAALDAHIDTLLSGEGDRSNLKEGVEFLKGIGPVQAEKLKAAGVTLVVDILRKGATPAGRAQLSAASGVPETTILKWVNFADLLRINGVGAVYARLLEAAGVDTVVELAQRNPVNLHAKLVEVNAEHKLSGRDPRQEEVTDWVAQAKELPRIIEY